VNTARGPKKYAPIITAGRSEAETVHMILEVVSSLLMCGLTDMRKGSFVTAIFPPENKGFRSTS
jgi:hypothetical protein